MSSKIGFQKKFGKNKENKYTIMPMSNRTSNKAHLSF